MPLVVIESPNKVRKLSKILGKGYKVMATKGHVQDLPPKKTGVATRNKSFDLTYEPLKGKKNLLDSIRKEAAKHDIVYIATDPDREGEAIGFHVASHLPTGTTVQRIRFNAITKGAVSDALRNPTDLDRDLFDAQQARRATDRLVGYRVSPVMWFKGLRGTSAGRVQSVALKYLSDREREIQAFVPEEYWYLDVVLGNGVQARLTHVGKPKAHIPSEEVAQSLYQSISDDPATVTVSKVSRTEKTYNPPPPFTTSTLQQAANSALGWGVSKTMKVAQDIFSKGLITYHRTDSVSVDPEALKQLRDTVRTKYGSDYLSPRTRNHKSKKSSQEAHECIRPTGEDPVGLGSDEARLLELIIARYESSQMASSLFEQMRVTFTKECGDVTYKFAAKGSRCLFDGYRKMYQSTTDVILPDMEEGQTLAIQSVPLEQKWTQPPSRYSDAALVKQMESDGVGRPATYASIIQTLLTRGYVTKSGRSFHVSEVGLKVCEYLETYFKDIVDPVFTSDMEAKLDLIAEGKAEYQPTLYAWYEGLKKTLKAASAADATPLFLTEHLCPVCKTHNFAKKYSNGKWWYPCSGYPECKTVAEVDSSGGILLKDGVPQVRQKKKTVQPSPELVTTPSCPKCGSDMRLNDGKFGRFWGCTQYRRGCKTTVDYVDPNEEAPEREIYRGVSCPTCSSEMYQTTGKYGDYLRCTKPDCSGNHPIPEGTCPECGDLVIKRYSRKRKKSFYCCVKWSAECDFVGSSLRNVKPLTDNSSITGIS